MLTVSTTTVCLFFALVFVVILPIDCCWKLFKKYVYFCNDSMTRVLIVGAGITGAVTASLLKYCLPQNSHIAVWELCRRAGFLSTFHLQALTKRLQIIWSSGLNVIIFIIVLHHHHHRHHHHHQLTF